MPTKAHDMACGMAALSICESLLLALNDLNVLADTDAVGIINDAASAHRDAGTTIDEKAMHQSVVTILDRIIASGNSVRRPAPNI